MKALVLVAHGSRRAVSNQEVKELACEIAGLVGDTYSLMGVGFLELAEPHIPEALENVISEGATDIDVFPYFLSAGRHVIADVPDKVNSVQEKYPDISITLLTHLGGLPGFKHFISSALMQSASRD